MKAGNSPKFGASSPNPYAELLKAMSEHNEGVQRHTDPTTGEISPTQLEHLNKDLFEKATPSSRQLPLAESHTSQTMAQTIEPRILEIADSDRTDTSNSREGRANRERTRSRSPKKDDETRPDRSSRSPRPRAADNRAANSSTEGSVKEPSKGGRPWDF